MHVQPCRMRRMRLGVTGVTGVDVSAVASDVMDTGSTWTGLDPKLRFGYSKDALVGNSETKMTYMVEINTLETFMDRDSLL
mmetsp:Transcript_6917/g.8525  ORF Transcript_6917/g.8525 Transcript_6917/m.8525 type:complete len:81 (+) Transcript_6917:208-450(+)